MDCSDEDGKNAAVASADLDHSLHLDLPVAKAVPAAAPAHGKATPTAAFGTRIAIDASLHHCL
jgi:hypothetical protein